MCTRQFKSKPTYKNYQFRPRSLPEYNEKRLYIAIVNLRIEYQQSICASLTTDVS